MQITFASIDSLELMQKLPPPTRTAEEGEELPSPEAVARRRARDEERRQQALEKTRRDREAKESDPEWRIGEEKDEEESDSDADGRRRGRGRGRGGGAARRGSRQQQQRAAKKTAPITTNSSSAAAAASSSSEAAAAAAAPQPTVLPTPITALYDLMGLAIPGTPRKPLENLSPRQKRRRRHQEELLATIEMIHKTTPAALQLAMATAAKMGSESPLLNALPSTPGSQTRRPKRKRESEEETATTDSAAAAAAVMYGSSSSSHATAAAATQKYTARDRRDAMLQE